MYNVWDWELLQYIYKIETKIYYVNFEDDITAGTEGAPIYDSHDLKDYRKKVELYLKEHSNNLSVYKLRNNKKLSKTDLKALEKISICRTIKYQSIMEVVADIRRNSEEIA